MTEYREEIKQWDRRVESHLRRQIKDGRRFFKSRYIADEFEVSVKKVGGAMHRLSNRSTILKIQAWGGTSDGTTWFIEMTNQ